MAILKDKKTITAAIFAGLILTGPAYAQLDLGGLGSIDIGGGGISVDVGGGAAGVDLGGGGADVSVGGLGGGGIGIESISESVGLGGLGTLTASTGAGNGGGSNINLSRNNGGTTTPTTPTSPIPGIPIPTSLQRNTMLSAFNQLPGGEQRRYVKGCSNVMLEPAAYEKSLVQLCMVLRGLTSSL